MNWRLLWLAGFTGGNTEDSWCFGWREEENKYRHGADYWSAGAFPGWTDHRPGRQYGQLRPNAAQEVRLYKTCNIPHLNHKKDVFIWNDIKVCDSFKINQNMIKLLILKKKNLNKFYIFKHFIYFSVTFIFTFDIYSFSRRFYPKRLTLRNTIGDTL